MRCPLCPIVSEIEQPLLAHLLRRHPAVATAASVALALGPIVLRKRPDMVLPYYGLLLLGALAISADAR